MCASSPPPSLFNASLSSLKPTWTLFCGRSFALPRVSSRERGEGTSGDGCRIRSLLVSVRVCVYVCVCLLTRVLTCVRLSPCLSSLLMISHPCRDSEHSFLFLRTIDLSLFSLASCSLFSHTGSLACHPLSCCCFRQACFFLRGFWTSLLSASRFSPCSLLSPCRGPIITSSAPSSISINVITIITAFPITHASISLLFHDALPYVLLFPVLFVLSGRLTCPLPLIFLLLPSPRFVFGVRFGNTSQGMVSVQCVQSHLEPIGCAAFPAWAV